jgi:hypothetical protein
MCLLFFSASLERNVQRGMAERLTRLCRPQLATYFTASEGLSFGSVQRAMFWIEVVKIVQLKLLSLTAWWTSPWISPGGMR